VVNIEEHRTKRERQKNTPTVQKLNKYRPFQKSYGLVRKLGVLLMMPKGETHTVKIKEYGTKRERQENTPTKQKLNEYWPFQKSYGLMRKLGVWLMMSKGERHIVQ